jgi:hypothetical protein
MMFPYPADTGEHMIGSRFFSLWIHSNEAGDGQIATATVCSNGNVVSGTGPSYTWDEMSANVSVSNADVGLGTGQITSGHTYFDRFSVREATRSWYNAGVNHIFLPSSDPCFDDQAAQWNTDGSRKGLAQWPGAWYGWYNWTGDPYQGNGLYGCNGGEYERIGCIDGLAPVSIQVQISGFQPLWQWTSWKPGDFGHVYTSHTDPGTDPQWQFSYVGCTTPPSGTYLLERSDLCIDVSCEGNSYVYEGSCGCGDFTITLDWGIGYGSVDTSLGIQVWPYHSPLYGRGYYTNCGGSTVISHANQLDCFNAINNQSISPQGSSIGYGTGGALGWRITLNAYPWQYYLAADSATLTVTGVNYAD